MFSQETNHVLSWQDEVRQAYKKAIDLERFLGTPLPELSDYPLFIPQGLALKIKKAGKNSIFWKQFIPDTREQNQQKGFVDPIGDKVFAQEGQIIHRYRNRLLFTPTTKCPINCRYCFRKNELFTKDDLFSPAFQKTIHYLLEHPEVNEIIFTGGDPLFLSNQKIEEYLEAFSQIKSIKFIRFHTRFPVIIPQRLDFALKTIIQKFEKHFQKIFFVLHTNHSEELDEKVSFFIKAFEGRWLSQSVLLKGVNDDQEILKNLFLRLDELNIRPYYLHHPDHVKGAMHFYLSLEEGRKIVHSLRDELPGWLLPQYMLDIPGGLGKINALNPETFHFSGTLLDRKGQKRPIEL